MTRTADLIVVGGGLAGLAAAATAERAGASAVVLEAHGLGGRGRVTQRDGFVFNLGAHALYLGGEGYGILRELGVRPSGSAPLLGKYKLERDGELHQLPAGPGSLMRTTALSARSKAKLSRVLGMLPLTRERDYGSVTVNDWLESLELRDDALAVMQALLRISTYSNTFDDLSADAAIGQLQRASSKGVLYLDGGWSQLIDGLRSQVATRTNSRVTGIEESASGVTVTTEDEPLHCRAVVVAAGPPDATAAVLPGAASLWGDIGEPVTAACLDVGVRGVPSPGYILSADEPLYGTIQGPPAARQAPTGDAAVAIIRYNARTADADRLDLERMLRKVGVTANAVVTQRFLARMTVTGAQPRARNGGLGGRPSVSTTGMPHVFLAGDWVGEHGMLVDAALSSGKQAALAAVRSIEHSTTLVG